MKRWSSTFAEQPSPAAPPVATEDLDMRMPCSHELGQQRGGALRIRGWSKRTGANGDRVQRASISSDRAGRSDSMDCMVLHCAAAATAMSCRTCKTKEHRSRQRKELFSRGFDCRACRELARSTMIVPRRGVGECGSAMFLHPPQPPDIYSYTLVTR